MARSPKFSITKTDSGWMLNVPASLSAAGKRERHYHKTRDQAQKHSKRLKEQVSEHGAGAAIIKPSLAEDATRASLILEPWGLSLTQAAQEISSIYEKNAASKTIEDAGQAWEASFGELRPDGLRPRTVKSYQYTLGRLKLALPGRLLTTIEPEEITKAITTKGVAGATYEVQRRNARAFWNWCAKKGWCDKTVFEKVDVARKNTDKEITFLKPKEASSLLRAAENHFPEAVPMYAVALFAGLRAAELARLEEKHVNKEGIELPASITNKGSRRFINHNDTLKAWLKVHPFKRCPNWAHVHCAVRRLAGWHVAAELLEKQVDTGKLKKMPKHPKGRWPQNVLRHTHASYAIAAGVALDSMLFEFGHVGGTETLRKHYLGRATKKQTEKFYNLRPSEK